MKLVADVHVGTLRFEVVVTSRDVETHKRMCERESRLKEAVRRAIATAMTEDTH